MFEKLTQVPIIVQDQDRALKFYTEALGFIKTQDTQQKGRPRWLTVAKKGQELEYILVKGDYVVDPRAPAGEDHGSNHFVFRSTDVKRDVEALKAKGVEFREGGAQDAPSGIVAYFTDTEGNHLMLLQRKE